MKRYIRILLLTCFFCCLMFVLAQTALAAEMYTTGPNVNFRSDASLDASVIKKLDKGVGVEVIEHDPAGWSKVEYDGKTGYIKSDYLSIPAGSEPVTFKTNDGVNFRTGPSTDSSIIIALSAGSSVEVLEHDPTGWSKVRANGTVGYIKSEFLTLTGQIAVQTTIGSDQSPGTLKTVDGVNFRSGPSTDSSVIKVLSANTSVSVLERDPAGWTKASVDGKVGYIRSDLLSVSGRNVELLDWSVVRGILPYNTPLHVIDVRTGRSFTIKCFSKGDHADVEPATKADTDIILDIRGGVWSWAARPIWVTIGDHLVAASIHAMPHSVSTIPDNGMDGHVCMHFLGSTTSSTSESYKKDLQNAVQEAWNAR